MTDNEKLQVWQTGNRYKIGAPAPDYLNDDAAAMSLLDMLVEKGFRWEMKGSDAGIWFEINKPYTNRLGDWVIACCWRNTRREAVVSAVLELLKEEKENELQNH